MNSFKLGEKKINHVGVIVSDIDAAVRRAWHEFGVGPWRLDAIGENVPMWYCGKPTQVIQRMAFGNIGELFVEMIQPVSGDSCMMDFLKEAGGGMHHIGFICENQEEMEETAIYLRKCGYQEIHLAREVGPMGDGDAYFFDTRETLGFILEVSAPITITQEMIDSETYYPPREVRDK